MEEALYITNIAKLCDYRNNFVRIYFGTEFCEKLLPSRIELKKVLKFVKKNKLEFSFVTPILTGRGIDRLKDLLKILPLGTEIIFNDWGTFKAIENKFVPVMGRLLSKQNRLAKDHNQDNNSNVTKHFFSDFDIKRVEIDNINLQTDYNHKQIKLSFYSPYEYLAVTRYCLFANNFRNDSNIPIFDCKKNCEGKLFKLVNPFVSLDMYLCGNAKFRLNCIPSKLEQNVDRKIYQILA